MKSKEEIAGIERACKITAEVLERLKEIVEPGVTTQELDKVAEEFIIKRRGRPAFKGYRDYPKTLCTSINNQVVHGIPSDTTVLKKGDILSIDLGVFIDGFYGDAAITVPVGKITSDAARLIRVTEEALYKGVDKAIIGSRLSDISHAIQAHVEGVGFSIVTAFVGHGIGRNLHEEPQVPNFGKPGQGPRLVEGMTLAIEPMVNMGGSDTIVLEDGWTAVTKDGSLSAHFEHTVAITDTEPLILTKI